MNSLEDTLVAALTETAAEIPADHLPPLRLPVRPARGGAWRPGRQDGGRSWIWLAAPVTAAAAVAGVTALSLVLTQQAGPAHRPPSVALGSGAAALPPDYAALIRQGKDGVASFRTRLVIRGTATGRTLATVDPPAPANSFCDLSGTPDGRTFVAQGCIVTGTSGTDQNILTRAERLYRFTVDGQGMVSRLSPLPIPGGFLPSGLAISPDGSRLALVTADRSRGDERNPAIRLYSLGTGHLLRSWTWAGRAEIIGRSVANGPLSWTADGTTIAFPVMLEHRAGQIVLQSSQVRLLDITAPGSSLRGTRQVLNFGDMPVTQAAPLLEGPDSMITPDGSRIVASSATVSGRPASTRLAVREYSAASGAPAAEFDPVTVRGKSALFRAVLWSSPYGSKLIAEGVPAGGMGLDRLLPIGVVTARGFTPLPGSLAGITLIAF